MDTWLIVLIVAIAVLVLAGLALWFAQRNRVGAAGRRETAREHLREAEVQGVEAERERALAEEQAARARRERAEVEERSRLAEQEAHHRVASADEHAGAARQLRAEAEKLAPGVGDEPGRPTTDGGASRR